MPLSRNVCGSSFENNLLIIEEIYLVVDLKLFVDDRRNVCGCRFEHNLLIIGEVCLFVDINIIC